MKKLPDADCLRKRANELEELEDTLAKKIIKAADEGAKQLKLALTFYDGDLNYFGKEKETVISILESKNYKIELIPEKILVGKYETSQESLLIDWS